MVPDVEEAANTSTCEKRIFTEGGAPPMPAQQASQRSMGAPKLDVFKVRLDGAL